MVIKIEGMYVCKMKYPMFLLIRKLRESLGYEPERGKKKLKYYWEPKRKVRTRKTQSKDLTYS